MAWGPKRRFEKALRRHCVTHLIGGHTLDGVLGGLYADGVELQHASYVRAGEDAVPLEGTQLIPWKSIIWVQEVNDGYGPGLEDA